MPLNFGTTGLSQGAMNGESGEPHQPFESPLVGGSPSAEKASEIPGSSPSEAGDYGEFEDGLFDATPARTTRASTTGPNPVAPLKTPFPVTPVVAPRTTGKSVLTTRVVLYSDRDLLKKTVCWGYIGREKMSFCTKDRKSCKVVAHKSKHNIRSDRFYIQAPGKETAFCRPTLRIRDLRGDEDPAQVELEEQPLTVWEDLFRARSAGRSPPGMSPNLAQEESEDEVEQEDLEAMEEVGLGLNSPPGRTRPTQDPRHSEDSSEHQPNLQNQIHQAPLATSRR